jgi:BirA family biotin operon repressor/biotin-[acetyl-CoA-carboxylase] ligase
VVATAATFAPFIAAMRAQRTPARLVGIGSVAGIRGLPGAEAYSASKAAVISYCESLRLELKPLRHPRRHAVPRLHRHPDDAGESVSDAVPDGAGEFAARAARVIAAGGSYAVIPWQMGVVAKVLRLLPNPVYDYAFGKAPHKPRKLSQHDGLSAAAITAHCATSATHVAIEVVAETGSTNADLLARVDTLNGPVLRIAENQTAGRGRAGRSWLSQPGAALMFSLAWRFKGPLHKMSGLPMAVGVALAETIAALGVPVQIKWPNDLLRDGKKLAGILVETQAAANTDGAIWAVIGVGMNLIMPDELEAAIGREVAAAPWLAKMDRNQLMAALLSRLAAVLAEFDDTGFAPFAERWNAAACMAGPRSGAARHGAVLQQGVAAGVDAIGRLLLDTRRAGSKSCPATSRCAYPHRISEQHDFTDRRRQYPCQMGAGRTNAALGDVACARRRRPRRSAQLELAWSEAVARAASTAS